LRDYDKQNLIITTDYITPWSRLLLEKLTLTKPVMKKLHNTAVQTSFISSWDFFAFKDSAFS
jgi:hypothetical protein